MNKELLINSLMMFLKEKCYQFAVPVDPLSDYDSFEDEFAECEDDYRTELIEIIEEFEHDECKRCTRAALADNILSVIEDAEQED